MGEGLPCSWAPVGTQVAAITSEKKHWKRRLTCRPDGRCDFKRQAGEAARPDAAQGAPWSCEACVEAALTMAERTPLLHYRLSTSVNESEPRPPPAGQAPPQHPGSPRQRSGHQREPQKLSVFFGVVIPTLLSMFSVVVFLRIGECRRSPVSSQITAHRSAMWERQRCAKPRSKISKRFLILPCSSVKVHGV